MIDIPGYEGLYAANEDGSVWNYERNKLMYGGSMRGYRYINLKKDGKYKTYQLHRIIASVFIPNTENKPQVNHKNGIRHDNRVENLEWCTAQENVLHGWRTNGRKATDKHRNSARNLGLSRGKKVMQLTKEGLLCKIYDSLHEAGRETNINFKNICTCANGGRKSVGGFIWKYL